MSNCCSHGTFLHFGLQSCVTHLNICYYHQDLHRGLFWLPSRAKAFYTEAPRPPTRDRIQKTISWAILLVFPRKKTTVSAGHRSACLSAIHFQGRSIRQVSCYTLLSGFRLPWPPSCCQDGPTPFVGSGMSTLSGTLARAFGWSRIASSAYQKWPTSNCFFQFFFLLNQFFFFEFFFVSLTHPVWAMQSNTILDVHSLRIGRERFAPESL